MAAADRVVDYEQVLPDLDRLLAHDIQTSEAAGLVDQENPELRYPLRSSLGRAYNIVGEGLSHILFTRDSRLRVEPADLLIFGSLILVAAQTYK